MHTLECFSPPQAHAVKSSKVCAKRTATRKPAQQAPAGKQKTSAPEAAMEPPTRQKPLTPSEKMDLPQN